ncbi:MAG: TIGR02597 family protein, partial [Phycisphaeraceae bacterium]
RPVETLTQTGSSFPGQATTVAASQSLDSGAYDGGSYYIRFIDGDAEGLWSTIVSNDGTSVTVEDAAVVALAESDDTFRIYAHHTIGSVLPATLEGTSFNSQCQLLIYDNDLSSISTNRSAAKVAFRANGSWIGAGVSADTLITPETQCILRNNSSEQLELILYGSVPDYAASTLVAPNGDVNIGTGYPVAMSLKNAGLDGAER